MIWRISLKGLIVLFASFWNIVNRFLHPRGDGSVGETPHFPEGFGGMKAPATFLAFDEHHIASIK